VKGTSDRCASITRVDPIPLTAPIWLLKMLHIVTLNLREAKPSFVASAPLATLSSLKRQLDARDRAGINNFLVWCN
jgi:hypothetical protein